ncbi:aminopeptidase [Rossellomorea vietnamensis]|uniref:Aminopeptidase n=2 Tax=Rossellomorea TaxID=2837508 RepID=A0A5D4K8A8_9BACI|nr:MULTISPECIES: aminopeptidase [Rossellomorea]TYR72985.1 aminopeptidase [Rossellomorea vietnamensis]TYS80866.1 aminopeptidase [Rossellomorea aquimaris]
MDFERNLDKYAELAVKAGVNIQKGQYLWISAPMGTERLVRKIVKQAYLAEAGEVHVQWYDEEIKRTHYEHAPDSAFEQFPEWMASAFDAVADRGGAFLQVEADDPDLLKGIPPERLLTFEKARGNALESFYEAIETDRISWSIIAMPSQKWADKVFPELPEEERVSALWDKIFEAVRINKDDPVDEWRKHIETLQAKAFQLNEKHFWKLHYTAPGTDLTIELPEKHLWLTGSSTNKEGTTFIANMPTEEVYTVPLKNGVNGYVTSTKPLAYQGNIIEDFKLTFEDGKIIKAEAETGQELLEKMMETDEGAKYLGEVALVPHKSPISETGILFFNTLFDENASNHLAIGSSYPTCYEGGQTLNEDERKAVGLNDSIVHEDFMIGSENMDIDGLFKDGSKEVVFRKGNWAF